MLLLLAIASASSQPPPKVHLVAQAKASVRIVRAVSAAEEWKSDETRHKHEVLIRESDGTTTRVRLIEHE
jgi:hypothetical protein